MGKAELIAWLRGLCAALRAELSPETTREWIDEIVGWKLTGEQWERLKREARVRFDRNFTLGHLHDLRRDLFPVVEMPGSPPVWEFVRDDDGRISAHRAERRAP
jgi:hypothetical protein